MGDFEIVRAVKVLGPELTGGLPLWVKDGPLLSRARSRSKGPLSDQVADAPDACGQWRSWVDSGGSIVVLRTAAIGALPPFTGTAAKDPLLPRADPRRGHQFRFNPLRAG